MALTSSIVRRAIRSLACFRRREIFGVPNMEICSRYDDVGRQFLPYLRYSTAATSGKHTAADTGLLRLVESGIKSIEHAHQECIKAFIPGGCPVKIEDNHEDKNIWKIISWKYHDENIKVVVPLGGPPVPKGYYKLDDNAPVVDHNGVRIIEYVFNENEEEAYRQRILMTVSVSKGDAHTLVFQITAFCDEICIDDLSVKNFEYSKNQLIHEGPYFNSLNDNLRQALTKYLDIRGINPALTNFLLDYLYTTIDFSKYSLKWFKALKGFMEKK